MARCPQCKDRVDVTVSTIVCGYIPIDENVLQYYPEIDGECADPSDMATCMECDHEAPLKEFVESEVES